MVIVTKQQWYILHLFPMSCAVWTEQILKKR
jgi:hypothetical protein